jgi:hypothetical protein
MVIFVILMVGGGLAFYANAKSNCQNGTLVKSAEPFKPYACIPDQP